MSAGQFVHLHVHTHYSLLDGACRVSDLVKRVKALGMDSIAISDHGCMFGVIEFYNECKKEGIKPIIGMEAYMAPGDRRERQQVNGESAYHLLLLAQNLQGYQNLIKLSSIAYREGFYYKPRIDKEVLRQYSDGLIATSACLGGEVATSFIKKDMKAAREVAETYLEIFGPERFFIEVQKHIKEQDAVNPELVELAKKVGAPLVATNDVHFLNKEDHFAHDVLCCISMGKLVSDEGRLKYPTELYLKSPQEMQEALGHFDGALENTVRIAQMCDLELDFKKRYAPVYRVPVEKLHADSRGLGVSPEQSREAAPAETLGQDAQATSIKDDEQYLRQLCEEGLIWRYGTTEVEPEVSERLNKELAVIAGKNFCSYFLIVWDFCNYARQNGIPVGARGSGVGTMVGYLLGLCNIDPLRYGLLFERFMDPSRNEMPDIDIDICQDGRQKVIEYVREKYGHVAQIITFGTLAAKAACKDVGRVLGVPLAEIDKLTKLIPGTPGMTLKKAMDQVPDLKDLYNSNPTIKQVIDLGRKLEGLCRNAGCHAAGVIIADQPLDSIVPLYRDSDGNVLTQFEGPIAEKCGLLKMDFLGLTTLTVLTRSIDLEKQTRSQRESEGKAAGEPQSSLKFPKPPVPLDDKDRIDIEKIDLTDQNVFDLFKRGETKGIFQFESGGMQDLLMKMQPDRIEDLIAANALYRPGPMELIPTYCNRKHGKEAVPKVHPIMDAILAETYGVMTYQEQVMQIFNQLGGIELSSAYKLIKAISKKTVDVIAKFQPEFIKGAMDKGVAKEKAEEIFDLILKFGGYGFNKCVVGKTNIIDADTGQCTTVADLFKNRRPFRVHALGEDMKLRPRAVSDVVWNGRKRVFELTTAQGRRITATDNHPFRTFNGWTTLGELKVGDRIAAPRALPVSSKSRWSKHELIVLAGLLAEGNTCHPSCLYFFGNDRRLVDDFADAASRFDNTVARVYARDERRFEVCLSTGRDARFAIGHRPWNAAGADSQSSLAVAEAPPAQRSGAYEWARRLDLLGHKATEKRIPGEVFTLRDSDVELFLGRLWAGDGFLANRTQAVPFYATSSPELACGVQLLLTRLGIISGVHHKKFKYRGTERDGYTVHLLGEGSIRRFLDRVAPHCTGREAQVELLRRYLESRRGATSKDTIPPEVRQWVDQQRQAAGLTWRELEARSRVSMKEFVGSGSVLKRGFRRTTIAKLADFFASKPLRNLATSDIFWDRIVSIEPKGEQDTYDLTVEEDHNFVADGLIVHNSHSTRYAVVAYQTAYMKLYHPVEYMAALLTYVMGSTDKVVEYIEDCRRLTLADGSRGIRVLPPDVNISDKDFTPVYIEKSDEATKRRSDGGKKKGAASDGSSPSLLRRSVVSSLSKQGLIRFGLMAVRGVGEKAVEAIIEQRAAGGDFASLYDFCERVDQRQVTRSTLEALIKCGAFSSLSAKRAPLLEVLERAVEMGQQLQQDKRSGQLSMFAQADPAAASHAPSPPSDHLPDVPELPSSDLLKFEKELLGFYVTSHPLTEHQATIERYSTASTRDAGTCSEGTEVLIGGMLSAVRSKVAKSGRSAGQKWAILELEDLEGKIEGMCFAESYADICARFPGVLTNEQIVFMRGKVDKKRETPSILVNDVLPIAIAIERLTTSIGVKLDRARHSAADLVMLRQTMQKHPGKKELYVQVPTDSGQKVSLKINGELGVRVSRDLVDDLENLLGPGSVQLGGEGQRRMKRLAQQQLFTPPGPPATPADLPDPAPEAAESELEPAME